MNRACDAVGISRATVYRHLKSKVSSVPLNKLCEVYATLLTEGTYSCSVRTMYRVLSGRSPVRDRRNQREPRSFAVPRLDASAPNQVRSLRPRRVSSVIATSGSVRHTSPLQNVGDLLCREIPLQQLD